MMPINAHHDAAAMPASLLHAAARASAAIALLGGKERPQFGQRITASLISGAPRFFGNAFETDRFGGQGKAVDPAPAAAGIDAAGA